MSRFPRGPLDFVIAEFAKCGIAQVLASLGGDEGFHGLPNAALPILGLDSGTRPAEWSSSACFFRSASIHERVRAEMRTCLRSCVHRKCFGQSQRLQNSSPAYLQSAEWRTKIVTTGVWGTRHLRTFLLIRTFSSSVRWNGSMPLAVAQK